jgi:hypothetical protein
MVETFTIQHPRRAGTADVVFAADYATAKLEALDCRTCRHLSTKHQECLSELRCEGGDQHQRQGKLMLWYTADLQGRGF